MWRLKCWTFMEQKIVILTASLTQYAIRFILEMMALHVVGEYLK